MGIEKYILDFFTIWYSTLIYCTIIATITNMLNGFGKRKINVPISTTDREQTYFHDGSQSDPFGSDGAQLLN